MSLSHLPPSLSAPVAALACWLDLRLARLLPPLLVGLFLACGRRTATSWFRAGGIPREFRSAYRVLAACGREAPRQAPCVLDAALPLLRRPSGRLLFGIDDSPTPRYGRHVEGAGVHRNPTPGPAGERHLYGHVWVTLAGLADHPRWDTVALPLLADLYVRRKDLPAVPKERRPVFRTKLEMAAEQVHWLLDELGEGVAAADVWVAVDGGYAKRPFLKAARARGVVVVSRLRKDAALYSLPAPKKAGQPGPQATYGKARISLAKRAGQKRGWREVECYQYGEARTKKVKAFRATWRPAGGAIAVVLVEEEGGWIPFFCTDPEAGVEEVLEAMADRGALEQANKDVKEVWGAGQQQVRNLDAAVGCFHLNLWAHTLTEVWAWGKPDRLLCDRTDSPWDREPRRPSHQDKRKALRRELLRGEIEAALSGRPNKAEIRRVCERLLRLAG